MESKTQPEDNQFDIPSAAKAVNNEYNQTYIILKSDIEKDVKKSGPNFDGHEVFFRW